MLVVVTFCLGFLQVLSSNAVLAEEQSLDRNGKVLPIFQVVRFPNDACIISGGAKNGTCYTAEECSNKGGINGGTCASGFGVCCTFTLGCGSTSSENCTYFDSAGTPTAGACRATVCKCNSNICQFRLDFNQFTITGPSTVTTAVAPLLNGNNDPNGAASLAEATQCLTDIFTVSNQNTLPVICGINNGQHVYFDADNDCHDLDFQLGEFANGVTSIATRQWSIKVSQYSCDYTNLAPSGCDQYYYGPEAANRVQSFNYDGGKHLANQRQTICVRRELGNCRICWYTDAATDVQIAKTANTGVADSKCCGYGTDGVKMTGPDCIQIPGAILTTNVPAIVSQCGHKGLCTTAACVVGTVCSKTVPFQFTFNSDGYEWSANEAMAANANTGFRVRYAQDNSCT